MVEEPGQQTDMGVFSRHRQLGAEIGSRANYPKELEFRGSILD